MNAHPSSPFRISIFQELHYNLHAHLVLIVYEQLCLVGKVRLSNGLGLCNRLPSAYSGAHRVMQLIAECVPWPLPMG